MGRQNIGQEFTGKYLSRNPFKKLLIEHYFNTVSKTVFKNLKLSMDRIPPSVLEVGCGAGFSTQYLREMFYSMRASEYRQDLVIQAQKRNPGIYIGQESIYNLSWYNNSFDLVVVLEVLEHLKHPWNALREVKRVTKQYALFSVPNEPLWSIAHVCNNDPGHIWHWTGDEFKCLVGEYFTVVSRVTSFPWQIILAEK